MKRTRSHQVSFRLNDKEYALLQRKLAASGKSLTEFFIETISKGKVIVINDFIPLLLELKRQGVNLNQLVRRANQFSPLSEHKTQAISRFLGSSRPTKDTQTSVLFLLEK